MGLPLWMREAMTNNKEQCLVCGVYQKKEDLYHLKVGCKDCTTIL